MRAASESKAGLPHIRTKTLSSMICRVIPVAA
jgi:hypothetical protein